MGARLAPYGFILLWSSSFITARAGLPLVSPLLFVAVRRAAALLALAMAVWRQSWKPLRGRWHHLAIAGILLNGVTLSAFHVGMVTENAAVMALVQALSPMLIAVSAVPLLGERLGRRQWLGLVLGAAGVVLVVAPRALESAGAWGAVRLGPDRRVDGPAAHLCRAQRPGEPDMIISGGENIHPAEIENVILGQLVVLELLAQGELVGSCRWRSWASVGVRSVGRRSRSSTRARIRPRTPRRLRRAGGQSPGRRRPPRSCR